MAFCDQCGTRLPDSARFCPSCGAPRAEQAAPAEERSEVAAAARPKAKPEPAEAAPPEVADAAPPNNRDAAPPQAEPQPAEAARPREEAAQEEPAQEEPATEEAAQEEPEQEEPAQEEPAQEEPAQEEPAQEEPAQEEPATEEAARGGAPRRPPPQAELVDQLGRLGRTPAVVAAGVIGGGTFVAVFAVGVVLAALPDQSLIGFLGADAGYLTEAFRQMVQLVLAGFENDALFEAFENTSRVAPGLFALVPALASLYLARGQLTRLLDAGLVPQLVTAAGGALVFAFLMLIPALLTGDIKADVGQTFGFALLWALVGGGAGTLLAAPPTTTLGRGRIVVTALRPLGAALLVTTAIGTAAWLVNVATVEDTRGARSLPIALIDTSLYAVDHGVHTFELGTLAAFEGRSLEPAVLSLPLPAEEPAEVLEPGGFRLLDYRDGTSAIVFLLMLAVLLLIPAATALFAGFTVAREQAVASPALGAAWGAIVGPVWAIALAIVNALLQNTLHGHAQGESVFGIVLVAGAALGALGGYLAARD
jgi:hypothetical protein